MRKFCWIAVAIFFFISGCTKIDTTTIGSGLIPPIDGVTTLETSLDVFTDNFINPTNDSLRVYKADDHIIGVINNDPLFGKTTAETYFELKPTSYKFSFPGGASVVPDSAVLILSYKGTFGDTAINQNWEVRELSEALNRDSAYPVSTQFATGNVLGSKSIDITTLNDSINYGLENASNQIRIKLAPEFASRFIKQYDSTDNNAYQSDSLFRLNFKGFAVSPAAGSAGNALIRINLLDTNTKLALFYNYKIPDSANRSNAVSYFRFSPGGSSSSVAVSSSANYIKRDYNGSPLYANVTDANKNDSLLFIQTSPGTFATVKIPGLSNLENSIIHRAELTVYQAQDPMSTDVIFTPPRYLLLSSYDSSKIVKTNIPNAFIYNSNSGTNNISSFGGFLTQKSVAGIGEAKCYIFDVSRYVQGIVTRKDKNLTLLLSAPSNDSLIYTAPYPAIAASAVHYYTTSSTANNAADGRVLLAGGGMSSANPLRMRLRIIYSRI